MTSPLLSNGLSEVGYLSTVNVREPTTNVAMVRAELLTPASRSKSAKTMLQSVCSFPRPDRPFTGCYAILRRVRPTCCIDSRDTRCQSRRIFEPLLFLPTQFPRQYYDHSFPQG